MVAERGDDEQLRKEREQRRGENACFERGGRRGCGEERQVRAEEVRAKVVSMIRAVEMVEEGVLDERCPPSVDVVARRQKGARE